MPRLFVSIALPEHIQDDLVQLFGDVPGARWVDPEQLHLTLRFIGEVDGLVGHDVREALDRVHAEPFPLRLEGVGHFPPRGRAHTLWAGLAPSQPLMTLRQRVESVLRRLEIDPDRRKYAPHVTLARLKSSPRDAVGHFLTTNAMFRTEEFLVEDFRLFSSQLTPKRAIHTLEGEYPLEAS